jgi:CRISPR/Cas system CMR-associated protein Cmr3 (group 5 of RAMP superfamily)
MSELHQSKSYPQTSILNPSQLQHVRSSHSVKGYAAILETERISPLLFEQLIQIKLSNFQQFQTFVCLHGLKLV